MEDEGGCGRGGGGRRPHGRVGRREAAGKKREQGRPQVRRGAGERKDQAAGEEGARPWGRGE